MISSSKRLITSKLSYINILFFVCNANANANDELFNMSLDKLMNMDMEIVSASKTNQRASDSPAAVFVISEEDIQRSGAIYIPDILRMVPGIFVGKNSSSEWVASSRGYTGKFSGDILVLINGRSVFSPLQNNINWEEQNIHVNDIERIEVIRGPGGSLWGANAVNGVINIITKSAEDNQYTHISARGGEGDKSSFYLSQGLTFGESGYVKLSGHETKKEGYEAKRTGLLEQDWKSHRVTLDAQWDDGIHFFDLRANQSKITTHPFWPEYTLTEPFLRLNDPEEVLDTYDFQSKFSLILSEQSRLSSRFSIDNFERKSLVFEETSRNVDLDIEWAYEFNQGHLLNTGINIRKNVSFYSTFDLLDIDVFPAESDINNISVFAQYTHFFTENFHLTAGAKVEDHSETGETIQPTLRALWVANYQHRFWASVSKSRSTPSRFEFSPANVEVATFAPGTLDPRIPIPVQIKFVNDGSELDTQSLVSNQIGWRFTPNNKINVDVTAFYNEYSHLSSTSDELLNQTIFGPTGPFQQITTFPARDGTAKAHGLEIAATWIVHDNWRFKYSGTHLNVRDDQANNPSLIDGSSILRNNADDWHSLRSMYDISKNLQFDIWLRYTDSVRNEPDIKAYTTVDVRLAWQAHEKLNVSFVARNLIDDQHIEYNREAFLVDRFYVEDTYSFQVDFKF